MTPASPEGKAASALRGYKGGTREILLELAWVLRECGEVLKIIE
jgi:hypothetical protein